MGEILQILCLPCNLADTFYDNELSRLAARGEGDGGGLLPPDPTPREDSRFHGFLRDHQFIPGTAWSLSPSVGRESFK